MNLSWSAESGLIRTQSRLPHAGLPFVWGIKETREQVRLVAPKELLYRVHVFKTVCKAMQFVERAEMEIQQTGRTTANEKKQAVKKESI